MKNWRRKNRKNSPAPKQGNTGYYHQKKGRNQQPIVDAINRLADEIKAEAKEDEREDRASATREKITIALVFFTFIAAGSGDWIFYDTMQDARQATVEGNRAWIGPVVTTISNPIVSGTPITGTIDYQNFGKAPATNVGHIFSVSPISSNDWISTGKNGGIYREQKWVDFCRSHQASDEAMVFFPSATSFQTLTWKITEFDLLKHYKTSFADINDGKSVLMVELCLVYKTFGITKHSVSCFYYDASQKTPGSMGICDTAYAD